MQLLKTLLQERDLVLEMWWSDKDQTFYCAYSKGESPRTTVVTARSTATLWKIIERETQDEQAQD